ncbi:hypothetical protein Tco_0995577 [Tanacetum coccineum]
MLAERRYPLIRESLERMMELRLTAKSEGEVVFDLLKFIQKKINEHQELASPEANGFCKELASPKQIALGKDMSNPLIIGSLLKTIWLSVHHVIAMKHWLFQSKRLLIGIYTKATDVPKKTTADSKKKQLKRKLALYDESDESEGELEQRPTGRKKRTPRAVVIQEPPSVPKLKLRKQSRKSDMKADFNIKLVAQVKELTGKSADSDEGAGTSPEGSTDDEKYLLAYKDEKPEDILWQSINDEESENDDEEDEPDEDKSIDIEKSDDERTNTDEEDTQKGDEHAGDEQVVVPVLTTQKERPSLLQSTSSHSVSSNFGNQFIDSPNASLIGTIPENSEAEINSLLDIQIKQDVPNIQQEPFYVVKVSAVKSIVERFTKLERAVKELKQADHSTAILASIRS